MKTLLNLLPQEKKAVIEREFRLRFLLWQLVCLLSIELLYIGIIWSAALTLNYERRALGMTEEGTAGEPEVSSHLVDYETQFSETNKQIGTVLSIQRGHVLFSNVLLILNSLIDSSIHVNTLTTKGYTLHLSGTADARDDLLKLGSRLKESECIKTFDIPLSSLFSQENVGFQIDIDMQPRCVQEHRL